MVQTVELNDGWIFTKNNTVTYSSEDIQEGEDVTIPHCWNQIDGQDGTPYYRGQCWYQRKLTLPEVDVTKRLYLEIGAAGMIGTVYINGQCAGESRCGYSMFRVPLNPYIQAGENLISIMVDNSLHKDVFPLMADFTFYGGLYRDVKLLVMEDIHFDLLDQGRDGVYLSQKKLENNAFELEVFGKIINESSIPRTGVLIVQVNDQESNMVLEERMELTLIAETAFNIKSVIYTPILWQGIENPYLYTVNASINIEGHTYDMRSIKYGFRTAEVTADRGLLLNGKPIKLNGVSRHQDYAGVGNAITKAHMEEDMSLIRDIGANTIRLSHYQHDDYFYSLCDHYGMLVWAEVPFISIPSTQDPQNQNAVDQLERLIKQAYNHCSIYCWGVQNEITIAVENEKTYESVKRLKALARHLDPGRLTAQANIYSVEDDSLLNSITDLVGYNLYYGWYYGEMKDLGERLDRFHRVQPNVPVLIAEYGVDTNPRFHSYSPQVKDYTEEYQLLFHQNALQTINDRPYVLGGYVWNMFDFGSANRNEGGESGKNLKGLVTIDRKIKKDAYYLYKAHWSKNSFVHIAGRRFTNRHNELNDIVILSNISVIKIYKDQVLLKEVKNDQPVKLVKDVALVRGENHLKVVGVDELGAIYSDEIVLHYVSEIDKSYVYVKKEEARHVVNWFEKFDLTNVKEIELKEGYYSTFDTIEDLYMNEKAKAVFLKYFEHTTHNPRFELTKGVMSIEKMSKLSFFKIPKDLLTVINTELNVIKK
ncbi:glycoside hydrolase family 2 protein [Paenibacillus whitsoniae]|uniref:Beta-galactosidase n=1 Tax=Paenibacillus whitsoniae TaxID=2496558 RepID=A0A430JJR3_9BACL|nr:glycoside hydrolase family 2 TIM barrel-domain containing protein [Paenibacillus whitsoniae]RTE11262.1 beta-galactosidase [Paenibacillus whitsoniae]